MLKRICFQLSKSVLEKNYGKLISGSAKARYNISPGNKMAIRTSEDAFLIWSKWGLISFESELLEDFNTTGLIDLSIPKQKEKVQKRETIRCIIPASGFFVWEENKGAYYAQYKTRNHFAFAGICENWEISKGKPIHTFSILQIPSTEAIGIYTQHLPVMLSSGDARIWLEGGIDIDDIADLRLDDQNLTFHTVIEEVKDPEVDHKGLIRNGNALNTGENFSLF